MDQMNNEKFILFISTLASIGLMIENLVMKWEFWVPVVVLIGIVSLWAMMLSDRFDDDIRKLFFIAYAVLILFYHGVHKTSFFDVGIVIVLVMATFSMLNKVYMMNILLLEYFIILFIHLINLPGGDPIVFDRLNVFRILLHLMIVLLVYYNSVRFINDRLDAEEENRIRDERIEQK